MKVKTGIVKSAGRALEILATLDACQRDMRMSDIALALDIPPSSASALLGTLTSMGFLDYDETNRTYRPSIRVAMLGTWVLGGSSSTVDVLNLMRRVHEETGQTITLVAQHGLHFQYVNIIEATEPVRLIIQIGVSRPIHLGASGIILLSLKKDDEIGRILRHFNAMNKDPRHTAHPKEVMKMVRKARRDGFFHSNGLYTPNAGILAVPLVLGSRFQPLAVGVAGFADVFGSNIPSYLESLNAAVEEFYAKHPAQDK